MVKKTTVASPPPRDDNALSIDDDELLLSPDQGAASRASGGSKGAVIDAAVHRFPFCIVWSPIPILTWFLPFIGHMGLADSKGVIFDFAGPYTIGHDDFAFGAATRYLQCTVAPEDVAKWDEAVAAGCKVYEKRMHNLCCDNCHSHVAVCLEHANYAGRKRWNMVELCFWMFFRGNADCYCEVHSVTMKSLNSVSSFRDSLSNSPTPAQMLAYTLSRAQRKVAMCLPFVRPSAPPNTPLIVIPDVSLSPGQDQEEQLEHHDGIDFSRLWAELDRLLEEGLSEDTGAVPETSQEVLDVAPDQADPGQEAPNTINVYNSHQDADNNSSTTEKLVLTLE